MGQGGAGLFANISETGRTSALNKCRCAHLKRWLTSELCRKLLYVQRLAYLGPLDLAPKARHPTHFLRLRFCVATWNFLPCIFYQVSANSRIDARGCRRCSKATLISERPFT